MLAHLPHRTSRHPQAVPLSFIRDNPRGGTEGRGPSLHVDASPASTLRPLFPYGPDNRGLPSYPRFPALRCCGSSVRKGNIVLRDRGTEGSAALRDDYGGQRERSRITRAAVLPALSALCQSEGLEDACSSFMRNPTHGGVPLLWWTGKLSTSQKNTAPP